MGGKPELQGLIIASVNLTKLQAGDKATTSKSANPPMAILRLFRTTQEYLDRFLG